MTISLAAAIIASPALAAQSDKPITDRDPDAMDIAKTPVTDLNVGRDDEIPPLLRTAVAHPYSLERLKTCGRIASAIGDLDAVLGPDIDLPQEKRARVSAGRVGKWVVASFIPFRGLVREASGANAQDRKVNAAIQAGLTRRGFLKGVGEARGCRYPASPAPDSVVKSRMARIEAAKRKSAKSAPPPTLAASKPAVPSEATEVSYKSEPDVRQPPPHE